MRAAFISILLSLAGALTAASAAAFEYEDRAQFGEAEAARVIRIISTADIDFFRPLIASYLAGAPEQAVDYVVVSSTELTRVIERGEAPFDVAISSAMDLQMKLANDGYGRQHSSSATQSLPGWAAWNDTLFAFTQEPAAIVVSKAAFAPGEVPRTRQALIDLLRREPERFRERVGTYDVRQSGLGYLFATQDTRASETFWRLAQVLGGLDVKLYCCSSDMIEAVRTGELLIAYNALGSYVANRPDRAEFEIVLPADFTTMMLRTALIPANAPNPDLSAEFVDHLLEMSHGPQATPLVDPLLGLGGGAEAALNRIQMGPGLLVFLDQLKRQAFLKEWEAAIEQGP
ncbi:MAG: ABC transporter substrate-binding protein [Pseudomonadota bacterium]